MNETLYLERIKKTNLRDRFKTDSEDVQELLGMRDIRFSQKEQTTYKVSQKLSLIIQAIVE